MLQGNSITEIWSDVIGYNAIWTYLKLHEYRGTVEAENIISRVGLPKESVIE